MLALLCAVAQGAWAEDTYDYPTKTKPQFYASYGGKSNVVVINTAAELAYITEHFDENSKFPVEDDDWSELNYYLNADINMGNSYSWMPLGVLLGHQVRGHVLGQRPHHHLHDTWPRRRGPGSVLHHS